MNKPLSYRNNLRAAVKRATISNPELPPTVIAERLGCSHVTVRKYQRLDGIYVRRVNNGAIVNEQKNK